MTLADQLIQEGGVRRHALATKLVSHEDTKIDDHHNRMACKSGQVDVMNQSHGIRTILRMTVDAKDGSMLRKTIRLNRQNEQNFSPRLSPRTLKSFEKQMQSDQKECIKGALDCRGDCPAARGTAISRIRAARPCR